MDPIANWPKKDLVQELLHFQEVASLILPRKENLPRLSCIDYFAATEPYKGCVCGDHLTIVNFDEYNIKEKIRIAQESGDDVLAARLSKNLDSFGILIADAAGHPPPIIFSSGSDRIERLGDERTVASTPLGILPLEYSVDIENFEPTTATKGKYHVNELRLLGDGDIMILYTDGLTEQREGGLNYCEARLEAVLRETKRESAREIYGAIRRDLDVFCPPTDDLTTAVIKKRPTS
jgi:hypothetical protein